MDRSYWIGLKLSKKELLAIGRAAGRVIVCLKGGGWICGKDKDQSVEELSVFIRKAALEKAIIKKMAFEKAITINKARRTK